MTTYDPKAPKYEHPLAADFIDITLNQVKPERDQLIRFAIANDVLSHLVKSYGKPPIKPRPPAIDMDDASLANKSRELQALQRPTHEDLAWLGLLGDWRFSAMRAEAEGASRVEVLFHAARTFASLGCDDQAGTVLAFLATEWNARFPVSRIPSYLEARIVAPKIARRSHELTLTVMEA